MQRDDPSAASDFRGAQIIQPDALRNAKHPPIQMRASLKLIRFLQCAQARSLCKIVSGFTVLRQNNAVPPQARGNGT